MLPNDELILEGMTSGEKVIFDDHGPYSYVFSDHEIRIQYRPSNERITEEEILGGIRGFQLQYMTETFNSCVDQFESWNGSFSTPIRLTDPRKYRPGMNCRWTIAKKSANLISAKINHFSLAKGDWLKIYESEEHKDNKIKETKDTVHRRLVGIYNHENLPPTSFAAISSSLIFEFHSENNSIGDKGFTVQYQQSLFSALYNY